MHARGTLPRGDNMRIKAMCPQCEEEEADDLFCTFEVQESDLYQLNCPRGHENLVAFQQLRFQVLAELAAHAIHDGYYRDAVTSFTATLERFYEFYIQVVCLKRTISEEEFGATWAQVRLQSERQMGAFAFLYLCETGLHPAMLSNHRVKFRNAVIHQGKIPSRDEALEYGQAVLDLIDPVLGQLENECKEQVLLIISRQRRRATELAEKLGKGPAKAGAMVTTLLRLPVLPGRQDTLARALRRIETFNMADHTPVILRPERPLADR
jgi:hypothetical protein